MKPLLRLVLSLALAAGASSAFAHAKLQDSIPANGAILSSPPSELRFDYNEAIEPVMSSVKLTGPGNATVAIEKAEPAKNDNKVLRVKLPTLTPGAYRAEWSTAGHDGHHTKGSIVFTVK